MKDSTIALIDEIEEIIYKKEQVVIHADTLLDIVGAVSKKNINAIRNAKTLTDNNRKWCIRAITDDI